MPFVHGVNTIFKVDDSGGVLRDLTTYVNKVDGLPGQGEVAETTTFGVTASSKTFIRGLNGATFTVSGGYDSTATTGPDVVLAGLRTATATATFNYGPEGSVAGKVQYSGECFLTDYKISSPVGDWVTWSASFTMTGALTKTTF